MITWILCICLFLQSDDDCCNSCEDVREAYRKKGWALSNPDLIDQVCPYNILTLSSILLLRIKYDSVDPYIWNLPITNVSNVHTFNLQLINMEFSKGTIFWPQIYYISGYLSEIVRTIYMIHLKLSAISKF